MGDIERVWLLYLKAGLFVGIGLASTLLLLLTHPGWDVALLLALAVWGFARAYYFMFYVIEHYIDRDHKFAGLWAFLIYVVRSRRANRRSS